MSTDLHLGKVLGKLESEVMGVILESKEPVSVRSVADKLQKKRKIAYTTVMTIMVRLAEKGLLKRKEFGKAFLYQSVYSKKKLLTRISHQIIRNFISSFGEPSVVHFMEEAEKLAPDMGDELRKILKQDKQSFFVNEAKPLRYVNKKR